jgi:diguanylate cyclase (GGDEF)-like protein/putative nucleotidyltransferase with HDIG domain
MSKPSYQDLESQIQALRNEIVLYQTKDQEMQVSLDKLTAELASASKLKDELDQKNNELSELNRIDGLTGLYNHQYVTTRCEHEFNRSLRYGTPLSCLMIDIDHFKSINDQYGHQFGDYILKELSVLLKRYSRTVDLIGRYGGEEFLVLVSRTEEKAYDYISRFHKILESHIFRLNDLSTRLTVSVGIAEQKKDIKTFQELIKRADQALYKAKEDGRNLIRIWARLDNQDAALDTLGIKNLKSQFETLSKQVKETYLQSTNALLRAIDARDHYTLLHSQQVADYSVQIARQLNLPEALVTVIKNAGLLHDIGKIGLEEKILVKTDPLTYEEFQLLKRHPIIGVNILKDIRFLEQELPFILHHHERFDGSGYPHGLKERSIPLGAKILAVADSYAAMTTDREFQKKKTQQEAIAELTSQKSKQFDPDMVDIFISVLNSSRQ